MMKRKWLSLIMLVFLIACGTAEEDQPPVPAHAQTNAQQKEQVSIFYTDEQIAQLIAEKREVGYTDEQEKYEKAVQLLKEPKEKGHIPLWPELKYHSLKVENGTATIDMDGTVQYNLGAGGEQLAIEALTSTLLQFPEIDTVQILVDGQIKDSLMGHVDISEPFKEK